MLKQQAYEGVFCLEHEIPLTALETGARAAVTNIDAAEPVRARLAQIGLREGTALSCRLKGKQIAAFEIQGAVYALREETCAQIKVLPEQSPPPAQTYLLTGNPNVGKSTLFNALTGLRQHTGNWCGKTVAAAEGMLREAEVPVRLIDTPGTCSVFSDTAEEAAAREMICTVPHSCIFCVADAACMERGLTLVLELLRLHRHVVLCVNMMDEAKRRHIRIDLEQLSAALHIPVLGISAHDKRSLAGLPAAAAQICSAEPLTPKLPDASEFAKITAECAAEAKFLCKSAVSVQGDPQKTEMRIDRLLTGKALRIPLMCLLLLVTFWITLIGADYPSQMLARGFELLCGGCMSLAETLHCPGWLSGALVDGMLRGVGWVVAVMLPPMCIFFPLFTLLEDSGILPRIAFNMDGAFARCKACGKQCLTMTMGFGCNAVGVTECRIIQSRRERMIAILTNALVPCNGRFPALLAVTGVYLAGSGAGAGLRSAGILTLLILLGVGMTLAASSVLGRTVLRGDRSLTVLELPPYRKPRVVQVLVRAFLDRTLRVLGRAVVTAAPVSLLIWLMANVTLGGENLLTRLGAVLDPVGMVFGLDGIILLGFLLGSPANEMILPVTVTAYLGARTLTDFGTQTALSGILAANGWTTQTACCFLLLMLFHAPCATTILTIYRETGSRRWTAAAVLLPVALGLTLCALLHAAWTLLNILI